MDEVGEDNLSSAALLTIQENYKIASKTAYKIACLDSCRDSNQGFCHDFCRESGMVLQKLVIKRLN